MANERKMKLLAPDLAQHLGKPHWHGAAWLYEDELPKEPTHIVKFERVSEVTFAREWALLREHHNLPEISEALSPRHFELIRELSEDKFLRAVRASYMANVYRTWSTLLEFLLSYNSPAPKEADLRSARQKNHVDNQGAKLMRDAVQKAGVRTMRGKSIK